MPRITAPTVAEHRAAQREALVRAGEAVLRGEGLGAVTPRAVCERAGLSRSSFYDYFPSRDDLLVAIAIDAIESWDAEIDVALRDIAPGPERLRALVSTTMAMLADGRHDIATSLREAELSPSRYEELMVLHDALMRPVSAVLTELGAPDPAATAVLVQALLGAGMQLVAHGRAPEVVTRDVIRVLERGVLS